MKHKSKDYQRCNRCIMDTSASDIVFDEKGVCNYCTELMERSGKLFFEDHDKLKPRMDHLLERVQKSGVNRKYDCIVGVSGGVDSSWTLVQVVKSGLRPLAVHMDNGWNSELAQNNIANLIDSLGIDLYTHVIEWGEYRNLMQAFFDSDVIDVELLYDNAMLSVNFRMAAKHKLKYILSGTNQSTEGMRMPPNWNWYKKDKKNLLSIAKRFGGVKLNTYPLIGTLEYQWYHKIRGIQWVSFLDYLNYDKEKCLLELEKNYGYKRYPYKHYESIFTRFYQGYLLPEKFGVDKRKLHLSTLIVSGQIERGEAIKILEDSPYPDKSKLEDDKQYFLKKMGWSISDLNDYINRKGKLHSEYPSEYRFAEKLSSMKQSIKK